MQEGAIPFMSVSVWPRIVATESHFPTPSVAENARRVIWHRSCDRALHGGVHPRAPRSQEQEPRRVEIMETLAILGAIGGGLGAALVVARLGMLALIALMPARSE